MAEYYLSTEEYRQISAKPTNRYLGRYLPLLILILATAIFWGPVKYKLIVLMKVPFVDYKQHIDIALKFAECGEIKIPYFLFHVITAGIHWLTGLEIRLSAYLSDMMAIILTAVIMFHFITSEIPSEHLFKGRLVAIPMTFFALLFAPIAFNGFMSSAPLGSWLRYLSFYTGYFHSANIYHNPTLLMLKPIALLLFWKYAAIISKFYAPDTRQFSLRSGLVMVLLIIFNALAKPNLLICFLPTVTMTILYFFVMALKCRGNYASSFFLSRIKFIILYAFGPTFIVLLIQYAFMFLNIFDLDIKDVSLKFAPFAVLANNFTLISFGANFTLSVAFLMSVYLLFRMKFVRNIYTILATVLTVVGLLYVILFADYINHKLSNAGNLFWSLQITLFITVAVTMKFMTHNMVNFHQLSPRDRTLTLISLTILSIHIFSGLYWYISLLHI